MPNSSPQVQIWQVLNNIPYGAVATYGQVARLAGLPNHARMVGSVLKQLPQGSKLPWHRVINARGHISFALGSARYLEQRKRLEAEGIQFDDELIKLIHYQWREQA